MMIAEMISPFLSGAFADVLENLRDWSSSDGGDKNGVELGKKNHGILFPDSEKCGFGSFAYLGKGIVQQVFQGQYRPPVTQPAQHVCCPDPHFDYLILQEWDQGH